MAIYEKFYLIFCKILNLHSWKVYAIGQIVIVIYGQILNKNIGNRSHWTDI